MFDMAKLMTLNRSLDGLDGRPPAYVLPRGERAPTYRRQVGAVFGIEFTGEYESNRRDESRRSGHPKLRFLL
jgi:hypothetical protein